MSRFGNTPLAAAVMVVASGGCGATTVGSAAYARSIDQDPVTPGSPWALVAEGQRVVVSGTAPGCEGTTAETRDGVEQGGAKLASEPWAAEASVWTITESLVTTGEDQGAGWLDLALRDGAGRERWIRMPGGKPVACVVPATEAITQALGRKGQHVVFTPWKPSCKRIEASGTAPRAALVDSEAGTEMEVGGVVLGPSSAAVKAAGPGARGGDQPPANEPWQLLQRGTLRVRADVLRDCFTDKAKSKETTIPRGEVAALAHTEIGRCIASDDNGHEHLECASSLGVWEGVLADDAVSLRLVRRTLGSVHFVGGRPVSGARYARAIVSVTMGARTDPRIGALYDAMERSVSRAFAGDDGGVRVAPASDAAVGYRLAVDVSGISIGPLQRREVTESTQYQDGTREVPNPELPRARERVDTATQGVQQANTDYQSAVEQNEESKRLVHAGYDTCLSAASNISDGNQRTLARTGCDIAKAGALAVLGNPSRDAISEAERELSSARSALESTPATITEPVMKPWTYKKTIFSRSVSAGVRVAMQAKDGAPATLDVPLSHGWEDYEVAADAPHNVQGHAPDQGPIDREDALMPFIATKASEALASKLRAAISRATLEEAKKALSASGQQTRPGFESVDAIAFDVARDRLKKPEQRSVAQLAGAGKLSPLPSAAVVLGPNECLLAVAVVDDESGGTVTLASSDRSVGDLRGKSFAVVEACSHELDGRTSLDDLAVEGPTPAAVRWGLYRTTRAAAATPR